MLPVALQVPAAAAVSGSTVRSNAIDRAITERQPGFLVLRLGKPPLFISAVVASASCVIVCTRPRRELILFAQISRGLPRCCKGWAKSLVMESCVVQPGRSEGRATLSFH